MATLILLNPWPPHNSSNCQSMQKSSLDVKFLLEKPLVPPLSSPIPLRPPYCHETHALGPSLWPRHTNKLGASTQLFSQGFSVIMGPRLGQYTLFSYAAALAVIYHAYATRE